MVENRERASARTRILRAAESLLEGSADGEVSTRDICLKAQVTAPTLYHHFADKQALLDEIVLTGFQDYLARKRSMGTSGDPSADLRHGWDIHVTFGCEHAASYRLMFGDPRPSHTPPAAVLARADLTRTVRDWERSGRLLVPIDLAVSTLFSAAVGTTLHLIELGADSTHPSSTGVRDVIANALIGRIPADEMTVGRVGGPARRLLEALPDGPVGPLGATEAALLREWLGAISQRSRTTTE